MRHLRAVTLMLCVCCAFGLSSSLAGPDINKVGAFLIFPDVSLDGMPSGGGEVVETLISVTNSSSQPYEMLVTFVNGDDSPGSPYCQLCQFEAALDGSTTRTFAIRAAVGGGVSIRALNDSLEFTCNWTRGFVTVSLQDSGFTQIDNVMYGHQVVFDYTNGRSHSTRAIAIQGQFDNNGDREFDFDGLEYDKVPRLLAADFVAPRNDGLPDGDVDVQITLFSLEYVFGLTPTSSCTITGYDADGTSFSTTVQYGCWGRFELGDISPEFNYPDLGSPPGPGHEHGSLAIECTVNGRVGGVHGIISRVEPASATWGGNAPIAAPAAWSRVLDQSTITGETVTLDFTPGRGHVVEAVRVGGER